MDVQPVVVEPDPRVRVTGDGEGLRVLGVRCAACGLATVERAPRCGACGGGTEPTLLRPNGTVWSWTVAGVGQDRGVAFAYVDLDDGPRVLARLQDGTSHAVGTRVRVSGTTPGGDLEARA